MPSTVVHLAVGALLAAALLGDEYDGRSLAVVLLVVAFPDLDTFVGIALPGTHRAVLHTLFVPLGLAALLAYDTRRRERSTLLRRYGWRGVTVAWVAIAAYVLAAIGPDLFYNGVNLFYPVVDRFFVISGELYLSSEHGVVQTIWTGGQSPAVGTTANTHYRTGVDVVRGTDPADAERVFPVAMSGLQLLLVVVGLAVTVVKLWAVRGGDGT